MFRVDGAVAADRRVVVEAVEQDLVDEAADLAAGRLDQAEPQVARRVLDAEAIAGDLAAGGQQHDAGGVGELLELRVVDVLEADGVGERVIEPAAPVRKCQPPSVPGRA